jgi:hypothetical protein
MGCNVSGGGGDEPLKLKDEKINSLVVEDVKVVKKEYEVEVPKYVEKPQVKYVEKVENQVKYNTVEKETVKYDVKSEPTVKYDVKTEETIQYVPKEVKVEKPVPTDVVYERPVIRDKEYVIATYKDIEAIRELMKVVPELMKQLGELKTKIMNTKDVKLVEETIKVPKLSWVTREEERIVWKDVPRERCKRCSGEINAN